MASSSSSSRQEIVEYNAFTAHQNQTERSIALPKLYDAFISHRGTDVKETLAAQLYDSLQERGCRGFLDSEEIQGGDSIPFTLQSAICSSAVQIAIFSKGYAESSWCLDELVLMLQQNKALFIPVFYEVEPWELRHIEKGVYATAFSEYESKRRYIHKLEGWKSALHQASILSGYELKKHKHNLCKRVVSAVVKEIEERQPLYVAKYPVGLNELVDDFETQCGHRVEENVKVVGIYGLGGCGKTTLAKELFNRKRSKYNASCFLHDVREACAKGELQCLQRKLLKDLFSDDCKFDNIDAGKTCLRNRLMRSYLSLLIVLDDIDHQDLLDALLFTDMLRSGNLVIVTTRDRRVLIQANITTDYSVREMDSHHAKELFCSYAFCQTDPVIGFEDLTERFVNFCGGLPLSLKVLGAHVSGGNDRRYWESALDKVSKTLPKDIRQRLKISFDSLDNDEKQIFMDIACFFIGEDKERALRIWKDSGWSADQALRTLRDKCLVEEENNSPHLWKVNVFRMHDHIRDLGRQMADDYSPPRLWRPEHLRSMESKGFRKILAETNRRCFHSFWDSSIRCGITYFIGNSYDCIETSAVLLWLGLRPDRGLKRIPSWIPLQNLQGLIDDCAVQRLCLDSLQVSSCSCNPLSNLPSKGRKRTTLHKHIQLRELQLCGYPWMRKLPNLIGILNHLEILELVLVESASRTERDAAAEWTSFAQSLTKLSNLRRLSLLNVSFNGEMALSNVKGSTHLESCCMNSLETILFKDASLSKLLISGEICPGLESLRLLIMHNLIEVDLNLVATLNFLELSWCMALNTISGLSGATDLVVLKLNVCSKIQELPSFAHLSRLERIHISRCEKLESIAGIEELDRLKYLHISGVGVGVWNCIYGLKRLPSHVTTVIRREYVGAESILNANLFSGVIDADSVSDIHSFKKNSKSFKMAGSLSAIVISLLLTCSTLDNVNTPTVTWDDFGSEDRIITIVVTSEKEIYRRDGPRSLLRQKYSEIKSGYIVNVRKGEEWRTIYIFKRIIGQLYLGIT